MLRRARPVASHELAPLPAAAPAANRTPVTEPAGHVLVVEDDAFMGSFMRVALAHSLIDATVVTTGEEALLRLAKESFDLILLDITLPGISGIEVCRWLKTDPRLRRIPVIFVTGHDNNTMRAQAFQLGAGEYLTKPFEMEVFLACVTRHLALAKTGASTQPR